MAETELKIVRFDPTTLGAIQELTETLKALKRTEDWFWAEIEALAGDIKSTLRNVSVEDEAIPEHVPSSQTFYFETEPE